AETAEAYVRERYEEAGYLLVRIGLAPKRAIIFRTEEPFKKISVPLIAIDETDEHRRNDQKIEFLADGQQFAAFGIHPDTKKPYSWHGGSPLNVPWLELPYIRQDAAQALIDGVVGLMLEFGYELKNKPKPKPTPRDPRGPFQRAPWGKYLDNL